MSAEDAVHPMLIDAEVKELVAAIEAPTSVSDGHLEDRITALVRKLREACARPENMARYAAYRSAEGILGPYPLADDGFAKAFDPLADEDGFFDCWSRYGVVVGRGVVPESLRETARKRVDELALGLSDGRCDLADPATWPMMPTDADGTPLLSRGFFEVYHDDALAQLRQAVRVYLHHVVLWGTAELWTTFDRFGVKLPGHAESGALPLHSDQNPKLDPGFATVQGILALTDCPAERGTFVAVPGSKKLFMDYAKFSPERGEYSELDTSADIAEVLRAHAQPLPLHAGDLVSWDSRTTHTNTANVSKETRIVALVSAGPAREDDPAAAQVRADAFRTGLGSNVREALMHASKKPRYTDPAALARVRAPERLTLLGKLLYGHATYRTI